MHNVLHIVRNPVLGGAEVLVKNIINANGDNDDFKHFLLYCKEGPLLDLIDQSKKSRLLQCTYKNRIGFILELKHFLKERNFDIVHIHQSIDVIHILSVSIGLKHKIVRSYHGYEGIDFNRKSESNKSKSLKILINSLGIIYQALDLHLFVSKNLMDVFRSSFKKHDKSVQKVLYNGIDPSPFLKQENLDIFREFDLPAGSLVMGMIGSFNDVRDHITVCKALKKIIEQKPEVHFLFIGRFSLCNKFYSECYNFCEENNLSDKVRFVGERNDVANLLNSLHLYVHSSNTDTFGIALVEAMAAKSPCLASDIPPFREVSDNGKYLTLFKKGDVDDLFKKINLMLLELNNKELSLRCEKAQQFAIKNFSIQAHLDNLHSYYREILKK